MLLNIIKGDKMTIKIDRKYGIKCNIKEVEYVECFINDINRLEKKYGIVEKEYERIDYYMDELESRWDIEKCWFNYKG